MPTLLRFDVSHDGDGRRWFVGVRVSSQCTRAAAALVAGGGRGLDVTATVAGTVTTDLPAEVGNLFRRLAEPGPHAMGPIASLRAQLAEVQAALVADLLAGLGVAPGRVLAVGVVDPGLWTIDGARPDGYMGLCDPARLAEATGLTVIDAFPARDLAQGGLGGPTAALAQWIVAGDARRTRALLDLGRTTRMTYLPPKAGEHAAQRVLSFDVGPGTAMLDALARQLTGGSHGFDPGGRLAVQGRRIGPLVDHWLANPFFDRPLPRWHPRGVRCERFLAEAMQMAVESGWSIRDVLCSATHFIAESVAAALRQRLPTDRPIDEVVVTGGGQRNGMLLREIGRRVESPLIAPSQLGLSGESLQTACGGVLAMLYVDQVPANPTSVTMADVPRLLGRVTPGTPQNWQRFIEATAGSRPARRPLRSAI